MDEAAEQRGGGHGARDGCKYPDLVPEDADAGDYDGRGSGNAGSDHKTGITARRIFMKKLLFDIRSAFLWGGIGSAIALAITLLIY